MKIIIHPLNLTTAGVLGFWVSKVHMASSCLVGWVRAAATAAVVGAETGLTKLALSPESSSLQ